MNAHLRLALTLLVAVVGLISAASADTSGPFDTLTPVPSARTDWTSSLLFPKFDSSLGTLLSVQLAITASYDTVLTVTNTSPSGSSGWAKTELLLSVQNAGGALVEPVLDMLTSPYTFSLGPGQSVTSGTIHKQATSSDTYTAPDILAAFTGPGIITLNASTLTNALLGYTGGNTNASQTTYASVTGKVTYNYTTVPELPASLLACIPAIGALVGRLRRP